MAFTEDLDAFRWLVEEWRVSIFAPELRTPVPVSAQRLTEAWKALAGAFGAEPLLLRDGGSIPILATLKEILGVDSHLLGLANPDSRIHSPDENMLVENFLGGISMNRILLQELAR
jgi:acetylornithine deacetylase/succinyl-diaminopimelate desuccinylase-like protein